MSPRFHPPTFALCLALASSAAAAAGEARIDAWGDPLPSGVVARLGTGRLCQPDVWYIAFSPDDKTLAALNRYGGLRLSDVRTGKELWRFEGPGYAGYRPGDSSVAFSPDRKLVAVACQDMTVRVFDAATGQERHKFGGLTDQMNTLAFSPDGKRLAAGGWSVGANKAKGESVRVWDLDGGKLLEPWGDLDLVQALAYSADGKSLFAVAEKSAGVWQRTLCRFDAATGKELSRAKLPKDVAEVGMVFSPGAEFLVVLRVHEKYLQLLDPTVIDKPDPNDIPMCDGKTIRLLDPATGKELRRIEGSLDMDFPYVRFSGDGRALTSTSPDGLVRRLGVRRRQAEARIQRTSHRGPPHRPVQRRGARGRGRPGRRGHSRLGRGEREGIARLRRPPRGAADGRLLPRRQNGPHHQPRARALCGRRGMGRLVVAALGRGYRQGVARDPGGFEGRSPLDGVLPRRRTAGGRHSRRPIAALGRRFREAAASVGRAHKSPAWSAGGPPWQKGEAPTGGGHLPPRLLRRRPDAVGGRERDRPSLGCGDRRRAARAGRRGGRLGPRELSRPRTGRR